MVVLTPDGAIDTSFGGGDGILQLPRTEWTYANVVAAPGAATRSAASLISSANTRSSP